MFEQRIKSFKIMKLLILMLIIDLAVSVSAKIDPFPPIMLVKSPAKTLSFEVAKPGESHKPFLIECEATSEPPPRYFWKKNGEIFNHQDYIYDNRIISIPDKGTLVFRIPSEEDEGEYQCFAGNEYGIATSNSVILKKSYLDDFPIINREFSLTGNESEPFKIACDNRPNGWPTPRVYWLLYFPENNTRTLITNNYNPRITIDPTGTLWFSSLTENDESKNFYYICGVFSDYKNNYMEINRYNVSVIKKNNETTKSSRFPPTKQYLSNNIEAISGQNIELFCIYGGNPMPRLRWEKAMRKIENSDKYKFRNNGRSLLIRNVDINDQGIYSCIVNNGYKYNMITLLVNELPYFTVEPKFIHAKENETVTIQCEANGKPKPEIKWTFNGQSIDQSFSDSHRKIQVNSVTIENVQKNDSGNYGCYATNSVGNVFKDVYLHIVGESNE